MANVDDRGQIILVIGLVLAVMFVALALVLNTAIFTENLATRSNDGASADAFEFQDDAVSSVEGAIAYANAHDNGSSTTLSDSIGDSVDDYNTLSSSHNAKSGKFVSTSVTSMTDGKRIFQTSSSALDSAAGSPDWTLATGVSNTRDFSMKVNPSITCVTLTDCFYVEFADASGNTWHIYVEDPDLDSSDTRITVKNAGGTQKSCTVGVETAKVNVTEGTISGESCEALSLLSDLPSSYDIHFRNGGDGSISGTYDVILETTSDTGNFGSAPDEPRIANAIYSATIEIDYHHPEVSYSNTVRVTSDGDEL
ncbi:hypothetical protein [Haladaptatus sp. DYSN1]|uniref:DUF7261 family protein n=1 Tax=unclassified Haladaptatus TaxID=2622732 RepID=UPI002404F3A5|nr:hypothetical protein [Haladaptatus sp. DYSN1]